MLDFGITLKPDMAPARLVALTRQAEAAGFGYGWIFDSHVLWLEPYPLLTMMALNTTRMRLGTCVTNPAVARPERDGERAGDAQHHLRRPDGPGDRPRRQRAARAGQEADDAGAAGGGDADHRRPGEWPADRV